MPFFALSDKLPSGGHLRHAPTPALDRPAVAEHPAAQAARNERSGIGPPRLSTTTSTPRSRCRTGAVESQPGQSSQLQSRNEVEQIGTPGSMARRMFAERSELV